MNIPQIMYERVVTKEGIFALAPLGIKYHEVDPFDITKYNLPSNTADYSGTIYTFFEGVFKQFFDKYQGDSGLLEEKVLNFAQSRLDYSINALGTASHGFKTQKGYVLDGYKTDGGLKDSLTGEDIPEDTIDAIAEQETQHWMSDYMWQPIRRIGIVLTVYPQLGEKLKPKIKEAILKYQAIANELTDPWLVDLSKSFAEYLTKQAERELDKLAPQSRV